MIIKQRWHFQIVMVFIKLNYKTKDMKILLKQNVFTIVD